ncbi:MAG: HIT domain-containing protein [Candidatus Omnitrophica bacterium]|nr:HIT domain-containing protein [Candidatus Omnitrophota bacterium]
MDLKPNDFILDSRLAADCFILGKLDLSVLLLMNNQLVPWFILVPQTDRKEICELNQNQQTALLKEINIISNFVKSEYPQVSKLNVAAIGNMVSQMHIHIVGRNPADYCWPNVVWGNQQKEAYHESEVAVITQKIRGIIA